MMLLFALVSVVQAGSIIVGFQRSFGTQLLAVTQIGVPSAMPLSVYEFMHSLGTTVPTKTPPAYTWYDFIKLPPSNTCIHRMDTVNGGASDWLPM
jgi:hypothetical protein